MNEQELLGLKKKIDDSKEKVAELQGRKKELMNSLKKDWKCSTVEDAKDKIATLREEITTLEVSKQEGIDELEKEYGL